MKIAVIGTGYVGLVTGVCLAEIGHDVTCLDVNEAKIKTLNEGRSPIYEPGLQEMISSNLAADRLHFTTSYAEGLDGAEVIYVAVGTPSNPDGTADLRALEGTVIQLASYIKKHVVVVTKSTVPIGTNDRIRELINENLSFKAATFDIVSNPEFLREGSAIQDTFHGDRIIIGSDNDKAAEIIEEINRPFQVPVYKTSIRSAEMIKYASNAFLATKISFINEISNLCDKLGADITEVAKGVGMDTRIGKHFLNAGIGYGGSCFPKDTKALLQIAGDIDHKFELLASVIEVNKKQQSLLVEKALNRFGSLKGLSVAVLGLAFKPNTDDMREAASIVIMEKLIESGANVKAYDPVAMNNAKMHLPKEVAYVSSIEEALQDSDCAFILTEWDEFKNLDIHQFKKSMKNPVIFDGRNCYSLDRIKQYDVEYYSVGRASIKNRNIIQAVMI